MVRTTTIKLDNEYLEELKAKAKAEDTDVSKYVRKLIKTDIESSGILTNTNFNIPPKPEDSLTQIQIQKPKEIKITPPKEVIKEKENTSEDTNKGKVYKMAEPTIDEIVEKKLNRREFSAKLDKVCKDNECILKEIELIKNKKPTIMDCPHCHKQTIVDGIPVCLNPKCGESVEFED